MTYFETYKSNHIIKLERKESIFSDQPMCIISIKDKYTNINLYEVILSTDDIIRLLDIIYSYNCFGGYNTNILPLSVSTNLTTYGFRLIKDLVNDLDILSISENNLERIRLVFNDVESTDTGLYDFYMTLYEEFLIDIVPLYMIAPDYDF